MFVDKSQLFLFLSSTIIIFLFIFFFSFVSFIYKQLIKLLFNFSITNSFFKDLIYGILISIYVYVLIKSKFSLNSITITIAPVLIYLFEKNRKPNILGLKTIGLKKHNRSLNTLISFAVVLFILILNFHFHFYANKVNTGYLDHAWYHSVAKNLQLTGIETLNIYINPENLKPGFIYHYWDLWTQAFFYDSLKILNSVGSLFDFNEFEINVLVFQPLLVIIIFFGFKELGLKICSKISTLQNSWIISVIAAIALC